MTSGKRNRCECGAFLTRVVWMQFSYGTCWAVYCKRCTGESKR